MRLDLAQKFPAADRQKQRFAIWWQGRSEREQALLAVLAGLALLWALFALVIMPLWTARSDAIAHIREYDMLSARLRDAGPLTGPRAPQRNGAPAAILTASATEIGLAPQITPDGDRYRVVMADAPYDAVMRWVADVERTSHLRFIEMRLERRPVRGYVAASFTVRG